MFQTEHLPQKDNHIKFIQMFNLYPILALFEDLNTYYRKLYSFFIYKT